MKRLVSQGTVSWFIGCHSPFHSVLVVLAWRKLHGRFPAFWEIVCIFLHDIGHLGRPYLDSYEEKKQHWKLGAEIARKLFGPKGYALVAGHCSYSGLPRSELYKADKYSWVLAPTWWLAWNNFVEPKLICGAETSMDAIRQFRSAVRHNVESGAYKTTHEIYLARAGRKP